MNYDENYRVWFNTLRPDRKFYMRGSDVPMSATYASLAREKAASHRGIKERTQLRELCALSVNQDFLDEIGCLHELEYLEIPKIFTAKDLRPLQALRKLRVLKINAPHKVTDFTPILGLANLERLFIENAKTMPDIDWLRPLKSQLKVLGIEGGMWTWQNIPSLSPLQGFNLEALFLTSARIQDLSLAPLRSMYTLKYLRIPEKYLPNRELEALKKALPDLECNLVS